MRRFPQVLLNVRVGDSSRLGRAEAVWDAVRRSEAELGENGRVLVRASGTEPLVRVMVEAATADEAAGHADTVAEVVRSSLGGS